MWCLVRKVPGFHAVELPSRVYILLDHNRNHNQRHHTGIREYFQMAGCRIGLQHRHDLNTPYKKQLCDLISPGLLTRLARKNWLKYCAATD